MGTTQTYVEHPTFETVWAALQETDRLIKELREDQKKTAEQMKRTDERMGYLSNRFGEMAEHLVKPGIFKRFVIEQSGDTMKIDVPDDFVPRRW